MHYKLLEDAYAYLGLLPNQFRDLTWEEFQALLKGYYVKREREIKDDLSLAWHISNNVWLTYSGKQPNYREIMDAPLFTEKKEQTEEEVLTIFRHLSNQFPGMVKIDKVD